jgi:antitoxin VapB
MLEKPSRTAYTPAMTTTLPADPETERLARDIAQATGKPLPLIVKEAIAAKAEAAGIAPRRGKRLDFARLEALIARSASRPVLDPRTPDEIIGYDQHGLPE